MYPYFDNLFSKFQCDFRKGFNAQHCLITMIEKWRRTVDGGGQAGALLTDLSKAFDCIDHELHLTWSNSSSERSSKFVRITESSNYTSFHQNFNLS